jgi:hypothetical protein
VGDWCTLIDAAHISGDSAGVWLVVDADAAIGWINIVDAAAQWPVARIASGEALWLPTAGQLKAWLRGLGYYVSTSEGMAPGGQVAPSTPRPGWAANILGDTARRTPSQPLAMSGFTHHCQVVRNGANTTYDSAGLSEAEAVAEVVAQVLSSDERVALRKGW